ncbi:MAG: molybdopterin cofactor-binding domain-containing protein [Betaproteobacteria bacterium]
MNLAFRLAQGGVRADLPPSLAVNPEIATWIAFADDGRIQVRSGKVEIGQGIRTALAQIAAEELCVPLARIDMVPTRTGLSPDEAVTSGSLSIQESGHAIRHLCADLRERLIARAATHWQVARQDCHAEDGSVVHPASGRRLVYEALESVSLLEGEVGSDPRPLAPQDHRIVGRSAPRLDLPAKLTGQSAYLHDLDLPGMLHGRVIRPRLPGATLRSLDPQVLARLDPRVSLWQDGSFVAVTSAHEWRAVKAAALLEGAATWERASLPFAGQPLHEWLPAQAVESKVIAERGEARAQPATYRARFSKPFIAHAALAPSCGVARWEGERLEVWSHSQGVYNLRADLALCFPGVQITVQHAEGAGCYGHNGADDVALDAALLSRLAGAPVRVLWSRRDEFVRSPLGSGMTMEISASLQGQRITAWTHEVWSYGHSLRPGRADTPTLLAASEIEKGFAPRVAINAALAAGGGSERNAIPAYDFGHLRVTNHRLLQMPVRTSALRSLGAFGNVFAIEASMDDLAEEAGMDAFDFRLAHLPDVRARRVIERLRQHLGDEWTAPQADGQGWGMAFAHYKNTGAWCAVAAQVEVSDEVRARRLVVVADLGLVINPDGAAHQLEGGALQACSWALLEEMPFDAEGPAGVDWESYGIARFSQMPRVEVVLVDDPGQPSLGAGECAHGPTAAALGNAVKATLGIRIRHLPLSRQRIIEAIDDAQG